MKFKSLKKGSLDCVKESLAGIGVKLEMLGAWESDKRAVRKVKQNIPLLLETISDMRYALKNLVETIESTDTDKD